MSTSTINSRALREEIDYGINDQGLPIIVVYPEYKTKEELLLDGTLRPEVKALWANIPVFKDSMDKVPTLHVPMSLEVITDALNETGFMVGSKTTSDVYRYKK